MSEIPTTSEIETTSSLTSAEETSTTTSLEPEPSTTSETTTTTSESSTTSETSITLTSSSTTSESPTTTSETPTTTSETPTTTEVPPTTSETTTSTSSSSSTSNTATTPPPTADPSTSTTVSTDSGGGVVTITQITTPTPTLTGSPSPSSTSDDSNGGSTSFWDNTGAVAGTFTVVGLVGLGVIIFLVTAYIRRRRTRAYDKETDLAAAEAATAPVPTFPDDDQSYTANTGYGATSSAGYPAPSHASSHGTYAQAPLGHEAYEMTGPAPGGVFDHNAYYGGYGAGYGAGGGAEGYAGAGAAGVGVMRARSHNNGPGENAFGAPEGAPNPYAAYANSYPPQEQPHTARDFGNYYGSALDVPPRSPPSNTSSPPPPSVPATESYASHYRPGFDPATTPANNRLSAAYPGPGSSGHGDSLPNPFGRDDEMLSGEGGETDDEDDEDDRGKKTLKVANE